MQYQNIVLQYIRCPPYTWAHFKYPSSLCVCTHVYKHTHTHHPNTRKNREICKTNPLSLPLPKHSLPHQHQALTMNKLKKKPLPIHPHTRMQVLRNTCDTRTHVVEKLDSTNKRDAPTRVHMYTHTRVYINVYAYIYTNIHIYIYTHDTHAHIHAYMHTHIHTHAYAHLCTDRKSQYRRLNVSSNIKDAYTYPHTYACIYTYICIYTHVHNLQRVCSQMCMLVSKKTPV